MIQFQRSIRGWGGIFGAISYKLDRNDLISPQIRRAIITVQVAVTFKKSCLKTNNDEMVRNLQRILTTWTHQIS